MTAKMTKWAHRLVANTLVVLHDAHTLQRHQAAVRVGVHHLRAHLCDAPPCPLKVMHTSLCVFERSRFVCLKGAASRSVSGRNCSTSTLIFAIRPRTP